MLITKRFWFPLTFFCPYSDQKWVANILQNIILLLFSIIYNKDNITKTVLCVQTFSIVSASVSVFDSDKCVHAAVIPTWRSLWRSIWWREERTSGCLSSRTGTPYWQEEMMTGCPSPPAPARPAKPARSAAKGADRHSTKDVRTVE